MFYLFRCMIVGLILGAVIGFGVGHADEREITIGYAPFCYHFNAGAVDENEDYNELNEDNNHGIMLSVDQWFGLTFRNSHYNRTYAIGYEFRTSKWKPINEKFFIRGTLPVGIMYGYKEKLFNVGGFTPAAVPVLEIGYDRFSIKNMFIPVADCIYSAMFVWRF